MTQERIDEIHGNAFTMWKKTGSPQRPTPEQYAEFKQAGQPAAVGPAEAERAK